MAYFHQHPNFLASYDLEAVELNLIPEITIESRVRLQAQPLSTGRP